VTAVEEYAAVHNQNKKPFSWTKSARGVLQQVIRVNAQLSSKKNMALHQIELDWLPSIKIERIKKSCVAEEPGCKPLWMAKQRGGIRK